jgi:cell division protein FtsW
MKHAHLGAKTKPDWLLLVPVALLLALGLIMVYSASGAQSQDIYGDDSVIFMKQIYAFGAGIIAMMIGIFLPHNLYRHKFVLFPALFVVIGLLIAVNFQEATKGASRWFYIGSFGFQPSDLAKMVIIMYVAAFSTRLRDNIRWVDRLKYIVPMLVVTCGLILVQPDFGTTMVILFIVGIMLFLAGLPMRFLILGGVLLAPIVIGLVVSQPYRIKRIMDFVHEEHYQNRQAKLAFGSGGFSGVGLGEGKQKLHYLPEPHTDFIFATLGEEFGFLGTFFAMVFYMAFFIRGIRVLCRIPVGFSRILGTGLLMLLTVQAFMNISIALGLFPNKGITLPFMSAGGTSLMLSLAMVGILLNVSRAQVVENREVGA